MTDDIVARLREFASYSGCSATMMDAADEIERLRDTLREIAEAAGDPSAYMIARDALKEQTNDVP